MIVGYDREVEFLKEAANIYESINEEYKKICDMKDHQQIFLKVKDFVSHLSITKNFVLDAVLKDLTQIIHENVGLIITTTEFSDADSTSVQSLKDYVIISKLMSQYLLKEANSLKGVGNAGKKSDALSKAKNLDEISSNLHESMVQLDQLIENYKKD